jgi:hypothetical protein
MRLELLLGMSLVLAVGGFGELRADWKVTTVSTTEGDKSRTTEYFKKGLWRDGYIVVDFDLRRQVFWNDASRQYVVVRLPQNQPAALSSGPTIVINRETVDTGERKIFFGRSARRLRTREKREGLEEEIDGWYVNDEGFPSMLRGRGGAVAMLVFDVPEAAHARPVLKLNQTGPAPTGLAVWQKRTVAQVSPDGSHHNYESVTEVTELTEGVLPDDLFRPPEGYRRVIDFSGSPQLGWADCLRRGSEMIEDWISGADF